MATMCAAFVSCSAGQNVLSMSEKKRVHGLWLMCDDALRRSRLAGLAQGSKDVTMKSNSIRSYVGGIAQLFEFCYK